MRKILTGPFLLLLAFLPLGCTEAPPPSLNYKDREVVDSLFRIRADTLRPIYDSLCNARLDSIVQRNADSILQERRNEIERYLERIKKEGLGD